jgi:hypothetical protein
MALTTMCFPLLSRDLATPFRAVLLDSVSPEVNTSSFSSIPSFAASPARALPSASRASRPMECPNSEVATA